VTRPLVLERGAELDVLETALRGATGGTGSVVLISGEAGIGKTSLVRAFVLDRPDRARVLLGACDDLVTPRTLGPLRDAVRGAGGPLATALATGDRDAVLSALLTELADGTRPTVLVLEDVHWADDATLDVLRYVGRRVVDLPAVVVATYRDEEVGPSLQRVLGALGGPAVHRLAPARLSRAAVARLVGGTAATSAPLYRLTAGNPFFVSEMAAATGSASVSGAVPATVVDAVIARLHRLGPGERTALEQLSVVPSGVDLSLARAVVDDLGVLAGAERSGLLEMQAGTVAFRHELARHAVEAALPVAVRMQYNARVLAALLGRSDRDLARVVHHAVAAGDEAAVVGHAPAAARTANRLGAHTQEVALLEQALRHRHLLDPAEEAALWQEQAMALFTLDRVPDALDAGRRAAGLYEALGASGPLSEVLITLALAHWALVQPREALATAERAVRVLEPGADSRQHAYALAYLAGLQTNVDRTDEALGTSAAALAMARRLDAPDLVALGRIANGNARHKGGDRSAVDELCAGIDAAAALSAHVFVMTGYLVLVENLSQMGLLAETRRRIAEATAYAEERDVDIYLDPIRAYGCRLQVVCGEWEAAEAGLRGLLSTAGTGGVRHSLPELSRLLVRRGTDDAAAVVDRAVDFTRRTDARYQLVPALMARIELAWLTGRAADARDATAVLAVRTAVPGAERPRADLLRWLRRLGEPVQPFEGCPPEYAAGLRGDWRAAARGFAERGEPYEQALELADSGELEPTLEALRMLDELGARPAAALLRRRLRERGVTAVPRGPKPTTRANPAGLTDRQVEILRLLADGRTNAEIAAKLVLSVRTVDHHVSAVLQKLGITSRREVAGAFARLGVV
jgi:DNA-binding CsgD family transcriptional regulator/tetratricopeptide (TPR) repeat protein